MCSASDSISRKHYIDEGDGVVYDLVWKGISWSQYRERPSSAMCGEGCYWGRSFPKWQKYQGRWTQCRSTHILVSGILDADLLRSGWLSSVCSLYLCFYVIELMVSTESCVDSLKQFVVLLKNDTSQRMYLKTSIGSCHGKAYPRSASSDLLCRLFSIPTYSAYVLVRELPTLTINLIRFYKSQDFQVQL